MENLIYIFDAESRGTCRFGLKSLAVGHYIYRRRKHWLKSLAEGLILNIVK
jgi:hypothetical protein